MTHLLEFRTARYGVLRINHKSLRYQLIDRGPKMMLLHDSDQHRFSSSITGVPVL